MIQELSTGLEAAIVMISLIIIAGLSGFLSAIIWHVITKYYKKIFMKEDADVKISKSTPK